MLKRVSIFLSLVMVTGCRVGPIYEPPCVDAPSEWKGEHVGGTPPPPIENWWDIFGDKTLGELEEYAIGHSPNLYAALEKVAAARAIVGIGQSDLVPHVDLNPNTVSTGFLFEFLGLQAFPLTLPQGFSNLVRIHEEWYRLPINFSYELDLWGKLRSQVESDCFALEAEIEDYRNVFLTLTTDIASHYYLLRAYDAGIKVLREAIVVRKKELELNQSRFNKGLTSLLDVKQAEQDYFQTETILEDVNRRRRLEENVIAALLGIPASCFDIQEKPLVEPPPMIPASVPCKVVLQRPDLAKLERTMASQHALVTKAYASFFPSFSLTGALGFLSPEFKDFLRWQTRLWSWGSDVFQTVFDGGKKESDLDLAYANFGQANYAYQQQVINAFQEVENALVNIEWQTKETESLKSAFEAANQATALSKRRYEEGLVNYLDVVVTENTALNQEQAYIFAIGQRYLSTVQLIKSLGGSWASCNDE